MDRGGYKKTYDEHYWKTKKCFKCGKEGHLEYYCTEGNNKYNNKY